MLSYAKLLHYVYDEHTKKTPSFKGDLHRCTISSLLQQQKKKNSFVIGQSKPTVNMQRYENFY